MSATKPRRPLVLPLVVLGVVAIGGVAIWKLRGSGRQVMSPAQEAEQERRRVAAFDPAFDPAKPAGSLEGMVKDADGRPVDGAIVAAIRNRGKDEAPSFGRPNPRVATTAGGGRFRLQDVLPGEYGVTATAAEGAPARQAKVVVESGKKTDLTLTLGRGGVLLTGEVFDVGGGAIAGAKALLRSIRDFKGTESGANLFQVTSDDKGVFRARLTAGDYDLTVRAEGYAPARDRVTLSGPQSKRFRLNPAARLAGRVLVRGTDQPVAGASVWLRQDRLDSFVDRDATTNGDGAFSFDDLAAGGYVVVARGEHRIGLSRTVDVGIAQSVTDVEVLVDGGRAIRGTVVGIDGKGIAGARVSANRAEPPFERPVFARTGPGGAFALEGLLPAKYRVGGWMEGKLQAKPETAQVTSRDVEGMRLQLSVASVVRGQVLDTTGKGVPDANVIGTLEAKGPERQFAMDRVVTDAEGKFELRRMTEGKLTIVVKHAELGVAKWGPDETPAESAPVTLRLVAAASLSGTVKFEDGSPAPRATVVAQPAEPGSRMTGPPEQATTDEAGRFRIGGLEAGRYMAMARRNEIYGSTPRARQQVTLAAGEEKSGIELVVPVGGKRIAGRVVGADGKPVSGAVVTVGLEREGFAFRMPVREGAPQGSSAVSDADGAFTVDDIQDGKYTVWAADSTHADGEVKGVSAGATNVSIRLQGGASVAGVVQGRDGKPVADYAIVVVPGGRPGASPDERIRHQMSARMWSPSAQVHDPSGAFFVGRLSPGAYELSVTTADNLAGVLPVSIAAGEKKTGLTVVIESAAKIAGRVLEADSGAPLEGVRVFLMSAVSRQNALTGKDGSFTIEGVSPGRGRVDFRLGDGETHVPEHVDVEVKPGVATVDTGVIRLMKGSWREKTGGFGTRGRAGFTVSLLDGKPSVTGVVPGFPAEKAGLKQGELVLLVNGKSVEGLGNGALDFMAAGKLEEPLSVRVQPREGGAPRDVKVDRVPMDHDPARPGSGKSNAPTAAATPK